MWQAWTVCDAPTYRNVLYTASLISDTTLMVYTPVVFPLIDIFRYGQFGLLHFTINLYSASTTWFSIPHSSFV